MNPETGRAPPSDLCAAMRQVAEKLYPWTFEAYHKYRLAVSEKPKDA